jgi:gamma-glutamyl hercynylcysteine S-oxide synthase
MATSRVAPEVHPRLVKRLAEARGRTDDIFALLPPNSFYERPIAERHRLIFYFGHLEAFDWNLLSGPLGLASEEPELNRLFAFGIDPVDGGLPADVPSDWPSIARVEKYNERVRDLLDAKLKSQDEIVELADGKLLNVAIEHRLMHAETLAYLLHNLSADKKIRHATVVHDFSAAPQSRMAKIPAGVATLGQTGEGADAFGWDNEFKASKTDVPAFKIDVFPVTNSDFLKFWQAGGYEAGVYWKPEDWEWKEKVRLKHPHFWAPKLKSTSADSHSGWQYRSMFGTIPLPMGWPVYVSHAEASAYAKWAGKELPTEAQWHRAAYGTPEGNEREYPWGTAPPQSVHGNFHHKSWDAMPVQAHPAGTSAFGVFDLVGNGWEWTSTPFGPLPGFEPFSFYRGYSADFFDGKHFVIKGGSSRTDVCMLRRSFRNWFQPHYPHVYATFRCVEE